MIRFMLLFGLAIPAFAGVVPVAWPNPSVAWANTSYSGDYDQSGQKNLKSGRWETVDLTKVAPSGATHVSIHGILVITNGTQPATCDLQIWWRPHGQPGTAGSYMGQAISAVPGGGVRQNHTILVPVVWSGGKALVDIWYDALPAMSAWPDGCAWGFTYRPQFFLVP